MAKRAHLLAAATAVVLLEGARGFVRAPVVRPRAADPSSSRAPTAPSLARAASSSSSEEPPFALLFDCDGVIIETEELHRLAYNAAFERFDLAIDGAPVEWSVDYYDVLQNTVGGGKNKMFYHFRNTTGAFPTSENGKRPAPSTPEEERDLVDRLQATKTELYKDLVAQKAVARPGVLELMDEALADDRVKVGVCSASTKEAVTKVLDVTLGEDRRKMLDVCILGDDVSRLKPDPLIYATAADRLGIDPGRCVVVEDSAIGVRAAKGAGMRCVVTYTTSTAGEDFYGLGCDAKVPDLGSRGGVSLEMIFGPMREGGPDAELLADVRD